MGKAVLLSSAPDQARPNSNFRVADQPSGIVGSVARRPETMGENPRPSFSSSFLKGMVSIRAPLLAVPSSNRIYCPFRVEAANVGLQQTVWTLDSHRS
jgi:hypothetical protein